MLNRTTSTVFEGQAAELAECARQLRERWPLLFYYLERRDQTLERALARTPSQADFELCGVFNVRAYLARTLGQLPPGIGQLAHEKENRG